MPLSREARAQASQHMRVEESRQAAGAGREEPKESRPPERFDIPPEALGASPEDEDLELNETADWTKRNGDGKRKAA